MIRTLIGFMLVFGAVGGLDNDSNIFLCLIIGFIGLAVMASGVFTMSKN